MDYGMFNWPVTRSFVCIEMDKSTARHFIDKQYSQVLLCKTKTKSISYGGINITLAWDRTHLSPLG